MNKNIALSQEWQIFKAICPKSVLKKITSKNIGAPEYYSIANALFYLGFHEMWDEMLEKAPPEVEAEKAHAIKKGMSMHNSEEIDYICSLIIHGIKSSSLANLFKSSKYYHEQEHELYENSKRSK